MNGVRNEISRHRIAFSLISIVRAVFALGELIIVIRILFDLFKASSEALFVQWINAITDPLLWPFVGIFPPYELDGGFVLEIHAIIAFLFYAFLGYLLVQGILFIGSNRSTVRRKTRDY